MTVPKLATSQSGYGGRGYRIPGRLDHDNPLASGKPRQIVYPSVTTVLKQVAKPALDQWIADQVAAFAVANISYLMRVTEEIGWGYLRFFWSREPELVGSELRLHHEGVKNDAAELGTNVHEWAEAEIDGTYPHPETIAIEADEMVEELRGWLSQHEVVSHHAEFTMVNDTLGIAGTGDADWTITCLHEPVWNDDMGWFEYCMGTEPGPYRTLVDLKTSRSTWPEHGMQLAALNSCDILMREVPEGYEGALMHEGMRDKVKQRSWWVEEEAPHFERQILLHIRPNDLDSKGEVVESFCHVVDMSGDIQAYLKGFVGALALAEMNHELNKRSKAA